VAGGYDGFWKALKAFTRESGANVIRSRVDGEEWPLVGVQVRDSGMYFLRSAISSDPDIQVSSFMAQLPPGARAVDIGYVGALGERDTRQKDWRGYEVDGPRMTVEFGGQSPSPTPPDEGDFFDGVPDE